MMPVHIFCVDFYCDEFEAFVTHAANVTDFRSLKLKVLVVNDILLEINSLIFNPILNCKGKKFSDEENWYVISLLNYHYI